MTIINTTHKFIFVHVPKTAGSAVKQYFSQFTKYCDVEVGGTREAEAVAPYYIARFKLRKHSFAREIHEVIGGETFESFHKFSVVRNPFERTVSIYNFLKYTWRAWRDSDLMDNISSLDEFVNSKFFRGPGPDRIHMPQIRWLFDSNKQICIENLARLETLEEDLALICKALNLPRALASLERKNVSKVPDAAYMQSFSGAAVDAIRRRYELDFEHLKYSRDPDALLARKVGSRDFLHLRGHV